MFSVEFSSFFPENCRDGISYNQLHEVCYSSYMKELTIARFNLVVKCIDGSKFSMGYFNFFPSVFPKRELCKFLRFAGVQTSDIKSLLDNFFELISEFRFDNSGAPLFSHQLTLPTLRKPI